MAESFKERLARSGLAPVPNLPPRTLPVVHGNAAAPYANAALSAEVAKVASAPEGTRNATLNIAAFNLAQFIPGGALDEATIRFALESAATSAGLEAAEIRATLTSGINAGTQHPREIPEQPNLDLPAFDPQTGEVIEAPTTVFDALVAAETLKMRVRATAQRMLRVEREGLLPEPIINTLPDLLAQPDEEANYLVDEVWPTGGRFLLAAQYKAGKTTMVANLLRSLADGDMFLDRFKVNPPAGRIVLIDDELDPRMLRRWLRDQSIAAPERISVVALRGRLGTFDILDDHTRSQWAQRLREMNAEVVIFDCLRPVLDVLGLEEGREAGQFLVAFDNLCGEAGVGEAGIVHHAGHAGERSRGDSRLRDWPDVEWLLVRDKEDGQDAQPDAQRYFKAYGRDVDVAEGLLTHDPATRRLTYGDKNRRDTRLDKICPAVIEYVALNPGVSLRGVKAGCHIEGAGPDQVVRALNRCVGANQISRVEGPRNIFQHYARTGLVDV